MTIVALVPDLMDRSRLPSAVELPITFVRSIDDLPDEATVVLVDLARGFDLDELHRAAPNSRVIAFGPHVDDESLERARAAGIDEVMPRLRFFRDIAELLNQSRYAG